jgi:hypothetical protein
VCGAVQERALIGWSLHMMGFGAENPQLQLEMRDANRRKSLATTGHPHSSPPNPPPIASGRSAASCERCTTTETKGGAKSALAAPHVRSCSELSEKCPQARGGVRSGFGCALHKKKQRHC